MAKKKRYNDGGEIVVTGRRSNPVDTLTNFDLSRMSGLMPNIDGGGGGGGGLGGGRGGGMSSQRLNPLTPPAAPARDRMPVTPAVVRAPQSQLSSIMGDKAPKGYGARFRTGFAEGGKAKAKPVKKMAKGGSTASKRADGCATKGKTKGRFV